MPKNKGIFHYNLKTSLNLLKNNLLSGNMHGLLSQFLMGAAAASLNPPADTASVERPVISSPSPNFGERRNNATPSMVVIHGTGTTNIQQTLQFLTNPDPNQPDGRVSSHYVIDSDGTIYQLVPEAMRAWHAGLGRWGGILDVNSVSIGIELQNDGQAPYTQAQIEALVTLLRDIKTRYNILPQNVVGHADIAPGRRLDPGPLFPWRVLETSGLAMRPTNQAVPASATQPDLSLFRGFSIPRDLTNGKGRRPNP